MIAGECHNADVILLGHRGAPRLAPENTPESFRRALQAGAQGFEFDVRRSKDGRLVVIHDPRHGRMSVARSTASQLGLPLLEEVLQEFRSAWLDVELKIKGIEAPVLAVAHRYLHPNRFVVTSFRARVVREVKRLSPATATGWLFKRPVLALPRWARPPRLDYLCPHHSVLTGRLVRAARERGLGLVAWTVDTPAAMQRMKDLGVDVVITNLPGQFVRYV
jgi:glycerophosphoryl diester phosphodiesterase